MNAIIQLLVPPPKYHVDRLVPHAMTAGQPARLAGMFVIERGEDGEEQLSESQAVEILLENCDDAYGFPPYADIKHVLHRTGEHDLRPVEQSVVTGAFAGLPAVLLRSSTRDWWKLIPAHIEMDHQTPGRNGSVRDESLATISPMYAEAPALLTAEPEPLSAD
jgi:hypothetical protein